MKKIKISMITVLYNKPEIEGSIVNAIADYDTYESAVGVAEGLTRAGYEVEMFGIDKNNIADIRKIRSDGIFNLIEWTGSDMIYALEAFILVQRLDIPYTGSDAKGLLWSVDKIRMKKRFGELDIPSPKHQIFITGEEKKDKSLRFPLIIKPVYEHCGIGISQESVVSNVKKMKGKIKEGVAKFSQPMIAEEYIDGTELHVTIIETKGRPWILPPAEVCFSNINGALPIMTYDMKWDDKSPEYTLADVMKVPALPDSVMRELQLVARKCYIKMGARDYSRLDVRLHGNKPYVLEINNNPGIDFEPESGIAASARNAGFNFETLLTHIVENAVFRYYFKNQDNQRLEMTRNV